jgi:CubicO group peptidase (beta-lactamase class C family)
MPVPLLTGIENVTFSTGLFSIHDQAAESLQYHYTSPEIREATSGVNEVDATSIYRFASVSKLFTVYAALVALTDDQLNTPLSIIFPELAQFQSEHEGEDGNQTLYSPWDQVTPFGLASHLSGVIGNSPPFAIVDSWQNYASLAAVDPASAISPVTWGLPPYEESFPYFNPTCLAANSSCSGEQYIHESRARPPTFAPWTSPSYSNHGMSLLGISIAALASKTFDEVLQESLFTPLGMTSTYSVDPVDQVNRSVIALGGDPQTFFTDSGVPKASGGMFSTLSDLAKFSTSILNSTLLPKDKTERWLKPLVHTASPYFSVGGPWEIHRVPHSNGVVTDLYTKLGDSGPNGGIACVIPEYGAGFNLVDAYGGVSRSSLQGLLIDFVIRHMLPAFEAQAAREASQNLAGTYVVSGSSGLNSSLTLVINEAVPGLAVAQWISNSSDVLLHQADIFGHTGGLRLLPSIVERDSSKWAFRFVKINNATNVEATQRVGPLTWMMETNWDWALSGQFTHAGEPTNLAIFDINDTGKAQGLDLPAWRVRLEKSE